MSNRDLRETALQNTALGKLSVERQEINFYKNEVKEKPTFLLASQALWVIVALCIALLVYTFSFNQSVIELKKKNNYLSTSFRHLNESAEQAQGNEIKIEVMLKKQQIDKLSEIIAVKKSMIKFNEKYRQTKKIFAYQILEDINSNVVESMAIEEVVANQGGRKIAINGTVRNIVIATEFLKKMKDHVRYKKTNFGLLALKKIDGENSYSFAFLADEIARGVGR